MTEYLRQYEGLTIQINAAWSEENQSNLYRWRVVDSRRAIPLEGKYPFRDWHEAYSDAMRAIDQWQGVPAIATNVLNTPC